ncbi:hypothetical protein BHAOGJBA_4222 [Methylobacterium hispanicum]|uniref:Uncharacterized protein n=1 Tax=Methylobacterium hispanicum TaxID=270350 RepID=A0AAV4ZQ60_9HYPH|nr:hypothetical protein [Methylobacterium hispanicum]GJD90680.1 hypothetical protein BHAOGJBA_4222 [Methylobacterium hispanicum]
MSDHHDLAAATGPAWGARESGCFLKAFDATGRFLLVFEVAGGDGGAILAAEIGLRDAGAFDVLRDREGPRLFVYPVRGIEAFLKAGPVRAVRLFGDDVPPATHEALELFAGFRDTFPQVEAICERLAEIHRKALDRARRELRSFAAGGSAASEETLSAESRLQDWAEQISPERLPPGLRGDHALLTLAGRPLAERAAALLRILESFEEAARPKEPNGPRG